MNKQAHKGVSILIFAIYSYASTRRRQHVLRSPKDVVEGYGGHGATTVLCKATAHYRSQFLRTILY
jgi:hypothetical protein